MLRSFICILTDIAFSSSLFLKDLQSFSNAYAIEQFENFFDKKSQICPGILRRVFFF
jgi:hypothetical protein